MGSGPGGKNISASRVLPSLKAAPAAARSIPSMSVARSGKAAQAVAAVSAATPVSGSRRHRSRTMGHQVEAGPERIRRHRRRTHAPGRDPVMKTPETPFIGPRPRQSFAPRKVRPCGRKGSPGPAQVRSPTFRKCPHEDCARGDAPRGRRRQPEEGMPRAVKPINVRPKLRLLIARILHDAPNGTVLVGHNRSSEARNRIFSPVL